MTSSKLALDTSDAEAPDLVFIDMATVMLNASKVKTAEETEGSWSKQYAELIIRRDNPAF